MAALDWSQCPAVESIPGKVSGAWVFKGTRRHRQRLVAGETLAARAEHLVVEDIGVVRREAAPVRDATDRAWQSP